jgi:tellurite resistance protein
MSETLEAHEHAEHAAHEGRKHTALLISVLAAGLAFCEQGAQHADTRMTESAVAASDTWGQYQAKSIRANEARDFAAIAAVLPDNAGAAAEVARKFQADVDHFENDPKTGKSAIAAHAHALEEERDSAHLRLESFDNAAAALQLGIVLVTASVITGSVALTGAGAFLGLVGAVFALLALLDPALGAL